MGTKGVIGCNQAAFVIDTATQSSGSSYAGTPYARLWNKNSAMCLSCNLLNRRACIQSRGCLCKFIPADLPQMINRTFLLQYRLLCVIEDG